MVMHKVVIKIGDNEYDTGSLISTDPPTDDDWLMIAEMVSDYVNSLFPDDDLEWTEESNASNDG